MPYSIVLNGKVTDVVFKQHQKMPFLWNAFLEGTCIAQLFKTSKDNWSAVIQFAEVPNQYRHVSGFRSRRCALDYTIGIVKPILDARQL